MEARLREALAREDEPRARQGVLLNRAWELVGRVAEALEGEAAGDVRRWRDSSEWLAVVCATHDPHPLVERFAELPQIVAVLEQADRRAVGLTVDGVPLELAVAEPDRFGTELIRAAGSRAYVAALEPLPDGPDERAVMTCLVCPGARPSFARSRFAASRRHSSSAETSGGTSTVTPSGRTAGSASRRWAAPRGS
jgi:DNA polymerase (family 10)